MSFRARVFVVLVSSAVIGLTLPSASVAAVAPGAVGVWHGTAEGIEVSLRLLSSGDVNSTSASNYQVELSFTFSVNEDGGISGGGSGYYTDAHWHLSGVNGSNGSFDCDPPVTAEPFTVDVSGQASGDEAHLSLSMPDATETNADYDCGADYSGYATTSEYMAQSLALVGGGDLTFSLAGPASFTLQKQVSSGSGDNSESNQHIWSFSFTPPASAGTGGAGSGGGGGASGRQGGACGLSLTSVSANPSHASAGRAIAVSFDVSAAAHASLLVARPSGVTATVASLNVPAGHNTLVWGGWVGTLPATSGRYRLTVAAQGCNASREQSVAVTIG